VSKLYIDCRCGCDVLCIEKLFENEDQSSLYYFNMYRSHGPAGFWMRLSRAWKYFRKGEFAYSDMTVETRDIQRLIEFLESEMKPAVEHG